MRNTILFLMLYACAASCYMPPRAPRRTGLPAETLHVWVEPDPRMDASLVLAACNRWNMEAVNCFPAVSSALADVRVSVSEADCVHRKDGKPDGTYTLGAAWRGGSVKMMARCLHKIDGRFDPHQFGAVMAHEIGHQVGVWKHVAETCDDDAPTHRGDGARICGLALMNPFYHSLFDYVTKLDAMAFDEGEHDPPPYQDTPGAAEQPLCEFRASAP